MTTLTINMGLVDTTAPTLSSITAAKSGSASWTGSVSTDEANGTLFYVVTPNATETAATVKAGSSQAVTATGTQNLSGSGLSPSSTRYLHVLHRDAAGNDSDVASSSSFTTDALGSGSGTVTISVVHRGSIRVAPEGVFFRATVADASVNTATSRSGYDESWHKVTYLWDFGDPGKVSDKVLNVAAAHNDLNTGRGREVGHVFTDPGTYTVTCTAFGPNGLIGSDTFEVTVGDPDTAFPTTQTILVNAAGQGDAAYPGATVVTSINAAEAEYDTRNTNCRILLKRGETFTLSNSFLGLGGGNGRPNFYLGAYGTGAKPIVNRTGNFVATSTDFTGDFVITGLDLRGGWNSLNETGSTDSFIRIYTITSPRMHVINDTLIDGGFMAIYMPGSSGVLNSTHVHNSLITGWGDYAMFHSTAEGRVSVAGSAAVRKSLDWQGGAGSFSTNNSQGAIRNGGGATWNLRVSDVYSKCSWTVLNGIPGQQPGLRMNDGNSGDHRSHIDRCSFEGGAGVVKIGNGPATTNCVVERSIVVGNSATERSFEVFGTGITIRNNILVQPNVPLEASRTWDGFLHFDGTPTQPNVEFMVQNNTCVNLNADSQTGAQNQGVLLDGPTAGYNNLQNLNNVIYTPADPASQPEDPQLTSVDLATVQGQWVPRHTGLIWSGAQTLNTTFATPTGFMKDWRPDTGSPLIDSATGETPRDDFYGTVRVTADRGAVERT